MTTKCEQEHGEGAVLCVYCEFLKRQEKPASDPFFIVWSPQGVGPPRIKYKSVPDAVQAAKDMAKKYPKQEFFVLESVSSFRAKEPQLEVTIYG